jgi:hypothetical protein
MMMIKSTMLLLSYACFIGCLAGCQIAPRGGSTSASANEVQSGTTLNETIRGVLSAANQTASPITR